MLRSAPRSAEGSQGSRTLRALDRAIERSRQRGEGYRLVDDHEVVNTGFELPSGKTLPFWHVMFAKLDIDSKPLESS